MFWLAPLDRWNQHANGVLCKRHADAMVVPRGWTLDDRREPIPRLFRPPTSPQRAKGSTTERQRAPRRRTAGARAGATSRPAAASEQLQLDATPVETPMDPADLPRSIDLADPIDPIDPIDRADPVEAGDVTPTGDGEPASEWMPTFDTDDNLDGLLEVRSPLLARAFRGEDRPPRRPGS